LAWGRGEGGDRSGLGPVIARLSDALRGHDGRNIAHEGRPIEPAHSAPIQMRARALLAPAGCTLFSWDIPGSPTPGLGPRVRCREPRSWR
jgi:hypothetical protein